MTRIILKDIGDEKERALGALEELEREFNKQALNWLISMYDPRSGGMYYSASSRDNDQFEPDIESTTQTISLLTNLGLISLDANGVATDMPEGFANGARDFLRVRQDESDGYFYDPLYREIARKDKKERNTSFAVEALKTLAAAPLYPTAVEIISASVNKDDDISRCTQQREALLLGLRI